MDRETYAAEAALEERHWWFVGRRRLFAREIGRAGVSRDARVLDVGTSTGTNLRLMRDMGFSDVTGLDMSEEAIRFCRDKGLGEVRQGDICQMPFKDGHFDLVLATDIVEHVDDDARALSEIFRVVRPGGYVLMTVPAFQSLWGAQDILSHHKRRYRKKGFESLVAVSRLRVRRSYYFNFLLFLPIFLVRRIISMLKIPQKSENRFNAPVINEILLFLFTLDCLTAPFIRIPFGVSVLVLAQRPESE
ncbi:class I SAM-dependent methyltransferase [Marivibrio halodurans]|uniref:Class I SAM-dependent methyltransferase n=1 Tax=Marivibrio halodurans TaxID=2039722 RepID=A0A8J7V1A2_9PROT|nr:class I SAM-dependent methyltransferase [Marivibrio halodurans]MBP5855627.1 class I SAM-dependent methyltransferase [Marivibrio halodurans]